MVNMKSTSRKDDLESLMFLLCFLYTGSLPILDMLNGAIEDIIVGDFLKVFCKFRIENKELIHSLIKNKLPNSMATAFSYIQEMKFEEKPNYQLIKLWFAFNVEQEQNAFNTKLIVN